MHLVSLSPSLYTVKLILSRNSVSYASKVELVLC
jgi:hypothetical protein